MITRFISDEIFKPLNFEYRYDDNVKINSYEVGVDGNLNYSVTPSFSGIKDLKINNYTLNILSGNERLTDFIVLDQLNDVKNKICYIFYNPNENTVDENTFFWKFETNFISVSTVSENFNDFNIFEVEFIDSFNCKIFYNAINEKYALTYSTFLSSVQFVTLTARNFENYNTIFKYIYNKGDNQIFFYVNDTLNQFAVTYSNNKLILKKLDEYEITNRFFIKKIEDLESIKTNINWVSYKDDKNSNNLNVNNDKSYYNVKNNFLFSSLINSISSTIPINILTLKNQLNQENNQSRGNVFLNENETNLKEYESIFTGGYKEIGFEKINLGYTSYTTPFEFKSGKTTYFHVPHDIYPYKKLNINASKLAENGAVAGNCPLNSDKVWKKMANYKYSSPYGNAQEENTGQWLCAWLSAGSGPEVRPVWMDRFYKPNVATPFIAMSAIAEEIRYENSFDCYDIESGITDVPSSLTFERGCYYIYNHLGKNDYVNLIKTLSGNIFYNKLDSYKKTNFLDLDIDSNLYVFDGKTYGFIDSDKKFNYNQATFSFFGNKDNWETPNGNQIFGNYTNKGFGFFNYVSSTPYLLFKKNNAVEILNNNFEKIGSFSTSNISNSGIAGISRRGSFENLHVITDDFKLIEFDVNGSIVDVISDLKQSLSGDYINSVTNDDLYCYVQSNSGLIQIDLNTNNVSQFELTNIAGSGTNNYIVANRFNELFSIKGENPICWEDKIYFIDNNQIKVFLTSLSSTESFISLDEEITSFNIDIDGKIYVTSKDKLYVYSDRFNLNNTFSLSSSESDSLTAKSLTFIETFEYGELKKYKSIFLKDNVNNFIITLDESNTQSIKKIDKNYELIQKNLTISNYNFNTQYLFSFFGRNNYSFKVKLINQLNSEDTIDLIFLIKSKDIATGNRHFLFTIDCLNGLADFYLDGQLYQSQTFEGGKYSFTKIFQDIIYFGCDSFFNGTPAFQHFKDVSNYTYKDIEIENFYMFDKYINKFEALYFYSEKYPPNDLLFNMPCGSRNFIDTVDKIFTFNLPKYKSNIFDLNILNSGILYADIREDLTQYINEKLTDFIPAYSSLRKINWLETVSKPIYLEGDYNQSNTLTNLQ